MRGAFDEREARRLPPWVSEAQRGALASPSGSEASAVLAAGRLLRSDHLEPGLGAPLRDWLGALLKEASAAAAAEARAKAVLAEAEAVLGAAPRSLGWAWRVLEARDDLESLLWALGIAGAPAEGVLLAGAEALDRGASAALDDYARDLWRAPGTDARAWILPLARSSEPCWWLDPLVVGRLRAQVVGWLTRPLVGASIRAVPMPPRAARPEVASRFSALEAGAVERYLDAAPDAPIARYADRRVVVHAIGFDEDEEAMPPGLVVVPTGSAPAIARVTLEPAPPQPPFPLSDGRWWVPLAGLSGERVVAIELATSRGAKIEHLTLRPPLGSRES